MNPLTVLLAASLAIAAAAEDLAFTCTTDKPAIAYRPGETMTFAVQLLEGGKPAAGRRLAWTRRGDDGRSEHGEAVSSATAPLTVTTACDRPGFVHLAVTPLAADGKPVKNAKGQDIKGEFGAAVEPEKLDGVPEPADFDAFWDRQRAKLRQVPLSATRAAIAAKKAGFDAWDVAIECPGGRPVSGLLTMPSGAATRALIAQVSFMGYGVSSASQECRPDTLILTINAHGIANNREPAYYEALQNGALRGYAFSKAQNADPETAYFNGMMLRVLRALEYVRSLPEWNGRDLTAAGGSQGGFQALVAAGIDPLVTSCWAWKPWCCDLAGTTLGRLGGWRPEWVPGLGYYDPVHHARRIRCPTTIISGLGDYVCPPSGLAVVYGKLATAKKRIEFVQGSTHGYDAPPSEPRFTLKSE